MISKSELIDVTTDSMYLSVCDRSHESLDS